MSLTLYEAEVEKLAATDSQKARLKCYVAGYRFDFLVGCLVKQGLSQEEAITEALAQELRTL